MKKIERTIFCTLIAAVFIIPITGNTALASDETYYFDGYDDSPNGEAWEKLPEDMVNGNEYTMAGTKTEGDVELCNSNTCDDSFGSITKVEIRANASYCESLRNITLRPVFWGTTDGRDYTFTPTYWIMNRSEWFDITDDPNGPGAGRWTWNDVTNLDCDVEAENKPGGPSFVLACSMVQIRVTYTS